MVSLNDKDNCTPGLPMADCSGDCPKPEVVLDPAYQVHGSMRPLILDPTNHMAREFQYVTVVADVISYFIGFSGRAAEAQADCSDPDNFDGELCRSPVATCVHSRIHLVDSDGTAWTGGIVYPGDMITPVLIGGVVSNDSFTTTVTANLSVGIITKQFPAVCGNCIQPVCPTGSAAAAAAGSSPTAIIVNTTQPCEAEVVFKPTLNIGSCC